uniref:Uncharacterized protein n=1 Tax=Ditylenchus dipsaci TaxID=166011 RepID=A0A915DJR4_9BILA
MSTSFALIIAISPFMVAMVLIALTQKSAEAQESGNKTKYPDINKPDLDSDCNKKGCVLSWLDCYEAVYQCKKWNKEKPDNITDMPTLDCGTRECTCRDVYRICGRYTRGCNITNDCFLGVYKDRFPICVQQKVECLKKLVECFMVEWIPFLVRSYNPSDGKEYMDSNKCVKKFVECGDQEKECGRTNIKFTKPLSNLRCQLTKDWSENIAEWEYRENYFKSEENAEVFVSRDKTTSNIMLNMELPHQEANFTLVFTKLDPRIDVQVCQPAGSVCADAPGIELEIASIDARLALYVKSDALPSGCRLNIKIISQDFAKCIMQWLSLLNHDFTAVVQKDTHFCPSTTRNLTRVISNELDNTKSDAKDTRKVSQKTATKTVSNTLETGLALEIPKIMSKAGAGYTRTLKTDNMQDVKEDNKIEETSEVTRSFDYKITETLERNYKLKGGMFHHLNQLRITCDKLIGEDEAAEWRSPSTYIGWTGPEEDPPFEDVLAKMEKPVDEKCKLNSEDNEDEEEKEEDGDESAAVAKHYDIILQIAAYTLLLSLWSLMMMFKVENLLNILIWLFFFCCLIATETANPPYKQKSINKIKAYLTTFITDSQLSACVDIVVTDVQAGKNTSGILDEVKNEIMNSLTASQMTVGVQLFNYLNRDFGGLSNFEAIILDPVVVIASNNLMPFYNQTRNKIIEMQASSKGNTAVSKQMFHMFNSFLTLQRTTTILQRVKNDAMTPGNWTLVVQDFGEVIHFDKYNLS